MTYFPLEDAEPDDQHPELHQFPDWGEFGHPYGRPMPWLAETEAAWEPLTGDGPPPGSCSMLISKPSAVFEAPLVLLEDSGIGDTIGKVMRGEIKPPPRREPKRHRCLACWLVSLLPGHDRCSHGYVESACETCGEW